MTDQYETAADASRTIDSFSKQTPILTEEYFYYPDNSRPAYTVEVTTIKCRQGWEYDVSIRRIDTYNHGPDPRKPDEDETELVTLRLASEDIMNTVVITAMTHLDTNGEFDAETFEQEWNAEVEA